MSKQVTTDYDAIADDWDRVHQHSWGEFEFAKKLLTPPTTLIPSTSLRTGKGEKMYVLDAGCGNGRLVNWLRKNNFAGKYLGVDNSEKLLEKARKNFPKEEFENVDLVDFNPPSPHSGGATADFRPAKRGFRKLKNFNLVFCIAVLHHLPDQDSRLKVLQNLQASLKPGGKLFLTVWNLWQPRYWKFILQSYFKGSPRNCQIPFAGKIKRFVHAFTASELINLLEKAGFSSVEVFPAKKNKRAKILSARNLVAIARK